MSLATEKAHIRSQLKSNDRWILVGLITVYYHQTLSEQIARSNEEHNGVGFTVYDAKTLTAIAQHVLRQKSLDEIRRTRDIKLSDVMDKDWAIEAVRSKMPKYANQLVKIARANRSE